MDIIFDTIKKDKIFQKDFVNMTKNNVISFDSSRSNIIYAPNGVGKSSICKVLSGEGEFILTYNGQEYSHDDCDLFHVISDQNGRNVIDGEAKDFLLGDNIYEEFKLKESLDDRFASIFSSLKDSFKTIFKISKISDNKIKWLSYDTSIVKKIVKNNSKVTDLDIDEFINFIKNISIENVPQYDQEKMNFIIDESNYGIVNALVAIELLSKSKNIEKLEEYEDAIYVLTKYSRKTCCIVCDKKIDSVELLSKKSYSKDKLVDDLDEPTKLLVEQIMALEEDPFSIKSTIFSVIAESDYSLLISLKNELSMYISYFEKLTLNLLLSSIDNAFVEDNEKYIKLKDSPLLFSDEDICFIEEFVAKNIGKEIKLERRINKIVITLDSENLLGVDREHLKLSTGEQNFISLTFELLKAKNLKKEFIVIDDPISSFDSIFKNKLVFAIVKFLANKKVILFTHNLDLLRLINFQSNNEYNFYLLNNFENQQNGFIKVKKSETDLLLSVPNFLDFMRSDVINYIVDEKLFAYSLIPFLRGYVDLIREPNIKSDLTKLMHGYMSEQVDLHTIIFNLLGIELDEISLVSVSDILSLDVDLINEIIDKNNYPLLNSTLTNNLIYLFLRLKTERVLTDKLSASGEMLSQIINSAFRTTSSDDMKNRIFFFSKKTLLNEFNHFDGSLNIFQPAIDISDDLLNKEKIEIINRLNSFL